MPRGRGPRHPSRGRAETPPAGHHRGAGAGTADRGRGGPGATAADRRRGAAGGEPAILTDVRPLLERPDPWPLVLAAAAHLSTLEDAPAADGGPEAGLPGLVAPLLATAEPTCSALLAVIAELTADEVTARRIRRELDARGHALPRGVAGLRSLTVHRAVELTHPGGEVETLGLGLRTGSGDEATLVATVSHAIGTLVTDAFLLAGAHDEVVARFVRAAQEDPQRTCAELDPAEAHRRLAPAVMATLRAPDPPDETATWPACQPVVRWVLGHLPAHGHARGAHPGAPTSRDPATTTTADPAPAVPGAEEQDRDVPPAADRPETPPGATASLAELAGLVGGGSRTRWEAVADRELAREHRRYLGDLLRESVGGEERLRALETTPLPDEPLRLDGLDAATTQRVRELAGLTDACCRALLDREHRAACRRVLADVARSDPRSLRRGSPATTAAAIVWIVAAANRSADGRRRAQGPAVKDLADWFGIAGPPSRRARPLLAALGVPPERAAGGHLRLGTPRYLVGSRRQAIRDHWERLAERP